MRLLELRIHRLPGVHPGFTLGGLAAGVNVLTGPNASGKSSVMRAVRALFYESELRGQGVFVEGVFDDDGSRLEASRLGDSISWTSAGTQVPAPPLPDPRFISCYTLRLEDLGAPADADRDIAARIARELAGGYDLAAVMRSEPFRPRPQLGGNEQKELQAATDELVLAQRNSKELYARENQLAELRELRTAAEAAASEAKSLEAAMLLLGLRRRQRETGLRLEALPKGLDLLRGDELEQLAKLRTASEELQAGVQAARGRRQAAEAELISTGLSDGGSGDGPLNDGRMDGGRLGDGPTDGDIREARAELKRMQRLEPLAQRQRIEASKADLALREAREQLGAPPAREGEAAVARPRLDPEALHQVENGLVEMRDLEAQERQLRSELAGLAGDPGKAAELDRLRTARHELLAWLAAAGSDMWTAGRVVGLTLLLASFAALSWAALSGDGASELLPVRPDVGLLLLGIVVLLGLYLFGWGGSGRRRASREAFERCGVPGPDSWRVAEVHGLLGSLGQGIAVAERFELELERRGKVERQLEEVRRRLEAARAPLAELAERVGFDPACLDASFERWLKLVADHDRALAAGSDARVELHELEEQIEASRARLGSFLAGVGETPEQAEPNAEVLAARLESLERRLTVRNEADRAIAEAERERERLQVELGRNGREVRDLFERAGVSGADEAEAERELRRRLGAMAEWREHSQTLRDLSVEERSPLDRLSGRHDLLKLVADDDEPTLAVMLATRQEEAGRRDGYSERITTIETLVGEAERERTLERKRAARQGAEDRLRSRYQEAMSAAAGSFLLEAVENEHVAASRPETLRQADEWFGLFTRHRYALRFEPGSETPFSTKEASTGETRPVHELSTGTKAQLFLAVRIAFALHAEQGRRRLPLFLDEALTTADPERFRAVADSLSVLAESGRQIFYLTARAEDANFWHGSGVTAPAVVDIAKVRGTGAAITDPEALVLPERSPVPVPDTASAEQYALTLEVPAIDPWSAPDAVHSFHVVRHDLELLHGLLEAGVDRLGVLRSFLRADAEIHRLSAAEQRELEWRCRAADEWFALWRVGRGRPVDRRALEASGAVTPTYIDRLDELTRYVGGDAKRILEALRSGKVKGFREDRRVQLREWLADNGFLDERRTHSADELRHLVAAALVRGEGVGSAAGDTDLVELARSVADCLEAGLRAGTTHRVDG